MAYDETLATRIRSLLDGRKGLSEKKMFGGLAFFINGNMCVGVLGREMVLKVPRDQDAELLARKGCRPFDFTGRPMRGMVLVSGAVLSDADALADWVEPGISAAAALPPKQPKVAKPAHTAKPSRTAKPANTAKLSKLAKSSKSAKPAAKPARPAPTRKPPRR